MAQVTCNDGTTDVDNGKNAPCTYNGGVSDNKHQEYKLNNPNRGGGGGIPEDHTNDNNPRKGCNELLDLRFHCWRKQAQVGFGLGSALMLGYGIYNKKSTMSIIGLTLLGGLGGLIASSMIKK